MLAFQDHKGNEEDTKHTKEDSILIIDDDPRQTNDYSFRDFIEIRVSQSIFLRVLCVFFVHFVVLKHSAVK